MKKYLKIFVISAAVLCFFSSCGQKKGLWGLYASDTGESYEFAYSKVLCKGGDCADSKNSEGWYSQDGDTVICRFSDTEGTTQITWEYVFAYEEENNTVTLTAIRTKTQDADGNRTENEEPAQGVYKGVEK